EGPRNELEEFRGPPEAPRRLQTFSDRPTRGGASSFSAFELPREALRRSPTHATKPAKGPLARAPWRSRRSRGARRLIRARRKARTSPKSIPRLSPPGTSLPAAPSSPGPPHRKALARTGPAFLLVLRRPLVSRPSPPRSEAE